MLSIIKNNWKERLPSSSSCCCSSRELIVNEKEEEERIKYKIINAISVMYTFREKKIHNMINYNKRISNIL
jgi:hypothetical protein